MNMNSQTVDLDFIAQIVLRSEEKAALAQEENRKAQEENRKAQEENRLEFAKVNAKLDKIENNTVTIMGMLIQDFDGITPETKAELESVNEQLAEDELILPLVAAIKAGNTIPHHKNPKRQVKATVCNCYGRQNTVTVKDAVANLDLEDYVPSLIPLGNYISSIITKVFGVKFGSHYPIRLAPFIETLVTYHQTERTSPRQY